MDTFCQKYVRIQLKNFRGIKYNDTALKGDVIFKGKLTGGLKNDIRNFVFMRGVESPKIYTLMGSFCQ